MDDNQINQKIKEIAQRLESVGVRTVITHALITSFNGTPIGDYYQGRLIGFLSSIMWIYKNSKIIDEISQIKKEVLDEKFLL